MAAINNKPLNMWDVRRTHAGDVLRLGQRRVPIAQIADFHLEAVEEFNRRGLLLAGACFVGAAVVFMILVLDLGWMARFWLAVAGLGFFGTVSLVEALRQKPISYHQLRVSVHGGDEVVFTAPPGPHLDALMAVLREISLAGRTGR